MPKNYAQAVQKKARSPYLGRDGGDLAVEDLLELEAENARKAEYSASYDKEAVRKKSAAIFAKLIAAAKSEKAKTKTKKVKY